MKNNNQKFKTLFDTKIDFGAKDSSLFDISTPELNNPIIENKYDNQKFINDLDSNLIMENIDNTADNKVVKINLKIKALEKNLYQILEELKILELFNLDKDKDRRDELIRLKNNIVIKIDKLKSERKKFGFFYLISSYTNNKVSLENFRILLNKILSTLSIHYNNILNFLNYNNNNKYFN